MTQTLSRRQLLKGLGVGALGVGLGSTVGGRWYVARAQAAQQAARPLGFYRFALGDLQATVIQDATFVFPATNFAVNAAPEEVTEFVEENNIPSDVVTTVNVLLLQNGEEYTLIDTGNGVAAGAALMPTLELLGVDAGAINQVVISHFHPDHINGVLNGDALAFPNATYHFPQPEWDFLQNAPTGTPADEIIQAALATFGTVEEAGQLAFYEYDAEIAPGVQSVAAPGHSPGHSALLVASGSDQLLLTSDTVTNNVISVARPDWHFSFDAIPDQAVESRQNLLNRAADEQLRVFAYHFAFPGTGYIDRDGEGFRFNSALF